MKEQVIKAIEALGIEVFDNRFAEIEDCCDYLTIVFKEGEVFAVKGDYYYYYYTAGYNTILLGQNTDLDKIDFKGEIK